jgi:hypothetical protein
MDPGVPRPPPPIAFNVDTVRGYIDKASAAAAASMDPSLPRGYIEQIAARMGELEAESNRLRALVGTLDKDRQN